MHSVVLYVKRVNAKSLPVFDKKTAPQHRLRKPFVIKASGDCYLLLSLVNITFV